MKRRKEEKKITYILLRSARPKLFTANFAASSSSFHLLNTRKSPLILHNRHSSADWLAGDLVVVYFARRSHDVVVLLLVYFSISLISLLLSAVQFLFVWIVNCTRPLLCLVVGSSRADQTVACSSRFFHTVPSGGVKLGTNSIKKNVEAMFVDFSRERRDGARSSR